MEKSSTQAEAAPSAFLSPQAMAVVHDELMKLCGGQIDVTMMAPKIGNHLSGSNETARSSALLLRLKIGAFVRLLEWEAAGLRQFLVTNLPRAIDVLEDLIRRSVGLDERFPVHELVRRMLSVRLHDMAWEPFGPQRTPVFLVHGSQPDFIEHFARFLWEHRDMEIEGT
jgi:hypothetical protein